MKWSFKLGRILGIDVFVHVTFLLLLGFIGVAYWMKDQSLAAAFIGVAFFACLFLCVLLHEYGHALAARHYGVATKDITLLPIGGVARLERMPEKPAQELVVALAGPVVNVVIATGLFAGLVLSGKWQPLFEVSSLHGGFAQRLMLVNIFLVLFNLLPAFPMDGGRVLRSLLAMHLPYARATNIAAATGKGMAVVFGFVGLFVNPMLLLIALFVWIGASQEAGAVEMRSSFQGVRVREAMLTDFRTLSPHDPLAAAARLLLAGSQQDFPVVENGRTVGLLLHTDFFRALQERGDAVTVGSVMVTDYDMVSPDEALESALARVRPEKSRTLPVISDGVLVGLLTAENVGELFMIRAALGHRRPRTTPPPLPPVIAVPPVIQPPIGRPISPKPFSA
ncbi:MAG: site-2 protease family protein [Verrucomicrobiae bacterium]|nr:site-2 protease family protein [Verrucomicrobiae bacterium]